VRAGMGRNVLEGRNEGRGRLTKEGLGSGKKRKRRGAEDTESSSLVLEDLCGGGTGGFDVE